MTDSPAAPTAAAQTAAVSPPGQAVRVNLICVKMCWEGLDPVPSMTSPFHDVWVRREAEHPKGRKGLTLARAWEQMATEADEGLLICDSDVVIDPNDLNVMVAHVVSDREAVWTARVKLWPVSTHYPTWVWGHRKEVPAGMTDELEIMRWWQTDVDDPDYFTFCFTYLPRRLVERALEAGLKTWQYPHVDKNMHELAKAESFKVRVVKGDCFPKHVNFR